MGSQPDFPRPMFPNYRGSTVYVYHFTHFNSIQIKSNPITSIQFKSNHSAQFIQNNSIHSNHFEVIEV